MNFEDSKIKKYLAVYLAILVVGCLVVAFLVQRRKNKRAPVLNPSADTMSSVYTKEEIERDLNARTQKRDDAGMPSREEISQMLGQKNVSKKSNDSTQ
jgi:hypothetical protein